MAYSLNADYRFVLTHTTFIATGRVLTVHTAVCSQGVHLLNYHSHQSIRAILLAASLLSGCGTGAEGREDTLGNAETAPVGQSLPEPAIRRVDPPTLDAEQRRRQAEVDQYLAQRYDDLGWRIVETTQTYIGDIIDWLDPASVPGSDAKPPPKPSHTSASPSS